MGLAALKGLVLAAAVGYLLGAVPTGYLMCRLLRGADVREVGSGPTGGSNVRRIAGLPAGVATAAIDALLGLAAVAAATWLTGDPWAATVAGVMAVIGHNWSVFIGFGGGIGLTSLLGGLFWVSPLRTVAAGLLMLAFWLAVVKLLHVHRARATIIALALVGPLVWVLGVPLHGVVLGVLGGLVALIKTLPDWRREYA